MNENVVTIRNDSHLATELVEQLVRFTLEPFDVKRSRVLVLVEDAGYTTLWTAQPLDGRRDALPRALKPLVPPRTRFVLRVSVGHPVLFPANDYADWREALVAAVGVAARQAQEVYDGERHDCCRCTAWGEWRLAQFRLLDPPWAQLKADPRAPRGRPLLLANG